MFVFCTTIKARHSAFAARCGSHGAFQEIFATNRHRWMTHAGTFPDNALERDYGV